MIKRMVFAALLAMPAQADELRLAVTTSFENSGLADVLLPAYEAANGDTVRLIVVGTGQAMRLGAAGNADLVLVHAPRAERAAIAAGDFVRRREVMFNDFVVVGPTEDEAGVEDVQSAAAALLQIAAAEALFASRGDASGTHVAETALWEAAGIDPAASSGTWYRETGSGMGATLNAAVGMGAYVLSDRASWLTFGNQRQHRLLLEGDPVLFNQYSLLIVDAERHPHTAAAAAERFEAWITGPIGQALIADYSLEGQALFTANAD